MGLMSRNPTVFSHWRVKKGSLLALAERRVKVTILKNAQRIYHRKSILSRENDFTQRLIPSRKRTFVHLQSPLTHPVSPKREKQVWSCNKGHSPGTQTWLPRTTKMHHKIIKSFLSLTIDIQKNRSPVKLQRIIVERTERHRLCKRSVS